MAIFVLVHGSWQGSWVWREIIPRLTDAGYPAIAPDLPGHGLDPTPPEDVTFDDYVRALTAVVHGLEDASILVGHSMAAVVVNQVAAAVGDRVRALVSVSGIMPPDGASMMSSVGEFDPAYLAEVIWAPDRRTARISPAGARNFLYQRCPQTVVDGILPLLTAEPVAPYEAPIHRSGQHDPSVRRYYIACRQDRCVGPAQQQAIVDAESFDHVYSLDADHSPFFSDPAALATTLHSIAQAASLRSTACR